MNAPRPAIFILDGPVAVTGVFILARDMARALLGKADVIVILPNTAAFPPTELAECAAIHCLPIRALWRSLTAVAVQLPYLSQATS